MWGIIGAAAATFVLAAASQAEAQKPDVDADLRCVAVLSVAITNLQGEQRSGVIAGVMYFIGRIDGIAPDTDLRSELARVSNAMTPALIASEADRCGAILSEKGDVLQNVGNALGAGK